MDDDDDGDEDDGPAKMELRLHSPAGAEPIVYQWPLTSGSGSVSILSNCTLKIVLSLWKIRNIGARYVKCCYVICRLTLVLTADRTCIRKTRISPTVILSRCHIYFILKNQETFLILHIVWLLIIRLLYTRPLIDRCISSVYIEEKQCILRYFWKWCSVNLLCINYLLIIVLSIYVHIFYLLSIFTYLVPFIYSFYIYYLFVFYLYLLFILYLL